MTTESKITFNEWKSIYASNNIKYGEAAWSRINSHPLDNLLDLFVQILDDASPSETLIIERECKRDPSFTWDLVIYLRRLGLRLTVENHLDLFKRAKLAVDLASKFDDFRDIVTSLTLLNFGARNIGINMTEVLNNMDPNILRDKDSLFTQALDGDERIDKIIVKMFGPSEWR